MRALIQELHDLDEWKKTRDGYQGIFGGETAEIRKVGKKWELHFKGKVHKMPRRASFDHAEGVIKKVLGA